MMNWGNFTLRGGPQVEAGLTRLLEQVAETVRSAAPPTAYRALVLIGGYGRGEGGVEQTPAGERPHNNLDLVLIAESRRTASALRSTLHPLLETLAEPAGIRIDLTVLSVTQLLRARPLVIWCDMRGGHKTILGDPGFVPSITQLSLDKIWPPDVRNLLVNRGTLLLINDLLLGRTAHRPETRRAVIRHAVKAIIGYGDALLFFLGDYHWSYAQKQQRMRQRRDVPADFRQAYDQAVEFRFAPRYPDFLESDLGAWMDELRAQLEPVHLRCESLRLRRPLAGWDQYAACALRREWLDALASPVGMARCAKNFLRRPRLPEAVRWTRRFFLGGIDPTALLAILFPSVAYAQAGPATRAFARVVLGANSTAVEDLRLAYLRRWGTHADTHFVHFLESMGIRLEPPTGS